MTSQHTDTNVQKGIWSRSGRGFGAGATLVANEKPPTELPNYPQSDDEDSIDALLVDGNEEYMRYKSRISAALSAKDESIASYKKTNIIDIAKEVIVTFKDPVLQRYVPTLNKGREPAYFQIWVNYDKYTIILGKNTEKTLKNGIRMYSEYRPTRVIPKSETQCLRDEIANISIQRDRLITRSHALTTTNEVVRNDYDLCDKTLTVLREKLGQMSEQKIAPADEFPHRVRALKLALEIFSRHTPTADALLKTIKQLANPEAYRLECLEDEAARIADAEARERAYQMEKLAREAEMQPRYSGKELDDYERTKTLLRDKKFIPASLKKYEVDAQKFIDQSRHEATSTKDQELLEKTKDLLRLNQFIPNHLLRFKTDAEKCVRTEKLKKSVPSEEEINKVKEMQASKKFIPANLRHVAQYISSQVTEESKEIVFTPVRGIGAWTTQISLDEVRRPPPPKIVQQQDETISLHPQMKCRRDPDYYDSDDNSCYDEYDEGGDEIDPCGTYFDEYGQFREVWYKDEY